MHTGLMVNIVKKIHLILIGFTVWSCSDKVGTIVTTSPNEKLQILILEEDEYLTYQAFYDGEKILSKSKLGLQFSNKETFPSVGYSKTIERRFYENTWELPWGETRKVKNKFNETKITFRDHKNQKVGLGTVENGLAASGFPPEGSKKERCAVLCVKTHHVGAA